MANPFHLPLLSEGAETWNSWKRTHPYVVADFSEVHLEHLIFDNAHLIGGVTSKKSTSVTSTCVQPFLCEISVEQSYQAFLATPP